MTQHIEFVSSDYTNCSTFELIGQTISSSCDSNQALDEVMCTFVCMRAFSSLKVVGLVRA